MSSPMHPLLGGLTVVVHSDNIMFAVVLCHKSLAHLGGDVMSHFCLPVGCLCSLQLLLTVCYINYVCVNWDEL